MNDKAIETLCETPADEDPWTELKDGDRKPTGEDHLLIYLDGHDDEHQCVGYWNRLTRSWMVNGEDVGDGLCVTKYRLLDWPKQKAGK